MGISQAENRIVRAVCGLAALAVILLCGTAHAATTIPTAVTLEAQAFFVERIGGPAVSVQVLVGSGQCAETYESTPKQMARLGDARIYFALGMPMEETLLPRIRANFPGIVVVDARAGIPLRSFDHDFAVGANVSPPEAHVGHLHAGDDPHVWLNPRFAKTLAANVADGLARIDPVHAEEYRARLTALQAELDSLDTEIAATLAPVRGRDMLVYHPFYGYLADAYGLRQVAIEVGGFKPGSKYLTQVVEQARAVGGRAVFVQEGAATASAETVAREIGARVVMLDPMSRDYLNNMRLMAGRIRDGILGK